MVTDALAVGSRTGADPAVAPAGARAFRWAIAGHGWVARDHMAPGIAAAGGRVVAVADPAAAARARFAGPSFDDVAAMLAAEPVDALYVATPNHAHLAPVRAAAAAGVPVLCEKPLAASLADAEAIVAAAAALPVAGTAFDQRHHPAHRAITDAIAAGAIGRPVAVRIVYACWVDPRWSPEGAGAPNWRADPAAAGGGATIDLALHGLDLAEMLVAEPLERLHVTLQRRVHAYPVDDGGLLAGRTAGGVLVAAHVAYNCPEVLPRRRLEVLGEAGLIVATDTMGQSAGGRVTLTCGRSGAETPLAFDADLSPFAAQAAAFATAVRGGPDPFSLARDLRLMRLFDAAHREALACL
jgi:1,5-anhydro-D-fructose reductase (1,5-anhydro-D-mannitol-forming)